MRHDFFNRFTMLDFDYRAALAYGETRVYLERQGLPIGANDLLIAASALAYNLTLVTHNMGEFQRIPNLNLDDWEV